MSRLLLDTNVVLWLLLGDRDAVSSTAQQALADEGNVVAVSAVSVWEIAIKRSLGKLEIEDRWAAALTGLDLQPMPVTAQHAAAVERLAWHHRDPFDRLLLAQAGVERCAFVTADAALAPYGVELVW